MIVWRNFAPVQIDNCLTTMSPMKRTFRPGDIVKYRENYLANHVDETSEAYHRSQRFLVLGRNIAIDIRTQWSFDLRSVGPLGKILEIVSRSEDIP